MEENKETKPAPETKPEEKPEEKEEKEAVKEEPKASKLKKELEDLQKKNEELQKKFEEADKDKDSWKNRYYQVYADMENLRKQVQKETADYKRYAQKSLVEELIPALDGFDMALKTEPDDPKLKNYLTGFRMVYTKIIAVFNQIGVEVIAPKKGDEYDPHKMEAFETVEGEEDNKVADTFLKGYKLGDHLLRPAGVTVTKKAEKKEEKAEEAEKPEETAPEAAE